MDNELVKHTFNQFLHEHLNPEQYAAVTHHSGALLVISGAGSGKTRIITTRIAHLMINHTVPADHILALTFTNKAAREMKERIVQYMQGYQTALPFVGTFHGYCLQLLRRYNHLITIPDFSILDEDDQEHLISQIIKKHGLTKRITASQAVHHISYSKNNLATTELQDPLLRGIYQAYEREKYHNRSFDFDDLLLETVKLFHNPDFITRWHTTIHHILIDEYQDTNRVQHALLTRMALHDKKQYAVDSLCVVGDEDQSIYSWRGATVSNIMNFTRDFPQATVITIERNYRSVQPILDAANTVIKHNMHRNPKKLWSARPAHNRVIVLACNTEYQEGDVVVHAVKILEHKKSPCAVLYRAHYQSRALEEALIKNRIAYRIIGGIQFYARKEIKDILAYARLIVNPFDRISFMRVLNTPTRGLGEKCQDLIIERWNQEPLLNSLQVCRILITEQALNPARAQALGNFIGLFESINLNDKPHEILATLVARVGYIPYLQSTYEGNEATSKVENVKELINAAHHMAEQGVTTLDAFLEHVTLFQEQLQEVSHAHVVQLMTLHAAKGLEFDAVIICGVEEGILPSSRSIQSPEALEEERRLLYVGMTRAREHLIVTHAQARRMYGSWEHKKRSCFIQELNHEEAEHSISYWSTAQLYSFLSKWFNTTKEPASIPQSSIPAPTHVIKNKMDAMHIHQQVHHATFGVGVITQIDHKSTGSVHLTVKFKQGTKVIDARFVQPL